MVKIVITEVRRFRKVTPSRVVPPDPMIPGARPVTTPPAVEDYFALTIERRSPVRAVVPSALVVGFHFCRPTNQVLLWPTETFETVARASEVSHGPGDGPYFYGIAAPKDALATETARRDVLHKQLAKRDPARGTPVEVMLFPTASVMAAGLLTPGRWRTSVKPRAQVCTVWVHDDDDDDVDIDGDAAAAPAAAPDATEVRRLMALHKMRLDADDFDDQVERGWCLENMEALARVASSREVERDRTQANIDALKQLAVRMTARSPRQLSVEHLCTKGRLELERWRTEHYDWARAYAEHFEPHPSEHQPSPDAHPAFLKHEWLALEGAVPDLRTIDLICREFGVPVRIHVDTESAAEFVGAGGADLAPVHLYWDHDDRLHVLVPAAMVVADPRHPPERTVLVPALRALLGTDQIEIDDHVSWHRALPPIEIGAGAGADARSPTPAQQLRWLHDDEEVALAADVVEAGPEPRQRADGDLGWNDFPTIVPTPPVETRRGYLRRARDQVMSNSRTAQSARSAAVAGRVNPVAQPGAVAAARARREFDPTRGEGWSATFAPHTCGVADLGIVSSADLDRPGAGTGAGPAVVGTVRTRRRSRFSGYRHRLPVKVLDPDRFCFVHGDRVTVHYAIYNPLMVQRAELRLVCATTHHGEALWTMTLDQTALRTAFLRQAADLSKPANTLVGELAFPDQLDASVPIGMFGREARLLRQWGPYRLELTLQTQLFADPQQACTYFDVEDRLPLAAPAPEVDSLSDDDVIVFYLPERPAGEREPGIDAAKADLAERLRQGFVARADDGTGMVIAGATRDVTTQIKECYGALGLDLEPAEETQTVDNLRSVGHDPTRSAVALAAGDGHFYWTELEGWRRRDLRIGQVGDGAPGEAAFKLAPPAVTAELLKAWQVPGAEHPDTRTFYAAVVTTILPPEPKWFEKRKEIETTWVLYYRIQTAVTLGENLRSTVTVVTRDELVAEHQQLEAAGMAVPAHTPPAAAPPAEIAPAAEGLAPAQQYALAAAAVPLQQGLRERIAAESYSGAGDRLCIGEAVLEHVELVFDAPCTCARFRIGKVTLANVRLEHPPAPPPPTAATAATAATAGPATGPAPAGTTYSPPFTLIFEDVGVESQVNLLSRLLRAFGALGSRHDAHHTALRREYYEAQLRLVAHFVKVLADDPAGHSEQERATLRGVVGLLHAKTGVEQTVAAAQTKARAATNDPSGGALLSTALAEYNAAREGTLCSVDVLGTHALCIASAPPAQMSCAPDRSRTLRLIFDGDPQRAVDIELTHGWTPDQVFKAVEQGLAPRKLGRRVQFGRAYICTGREHLGASARCLGTLHLESSTAEPLDGSVRSMVTVEGHDEALAATGLAAGTTEIADLSTLAQEAALAALPPELRTMTAAEVAEFALQYVDDVLAHLDPSLEKMSWLLALQDCSRQAVVLWQAAVVPGVANAVRVRRVTVLADDLPQGRAWDHVTVEGVRYDLGRSEPTSATTGGTDTSRIRMERVVAEPLFDGPVTIDQLDSTQTVGLTPAGTAGPAHATGLSIVALSADQLALRGLEARQTAGDDGLLHGEATLDSARVRLRDVGPGDELTVRGDLVGENLFGSTEQAVGEPLTALFHGRAGLDGLAIQSRSARLGTLLAKMDEVRAALVEESRTGTPAASFGPQMGAAHDLITVILRASPAPRGQEATRVRRQLELAGRATAAAAGPAATAGAVAAGTAPGTPDRGFALRRHAYFEMHKAVDGAADLEMGTAPLVLFVSQATVDLDETGSGRIRLYLRYNAVEAKRHHEGRKLALERERDLLLQGKTEKENAKKDDETQSRLKRVQNFHRKARPMLTGVLPFDPDRDIPDPTAREQYRLQQREAEECSARRAAAKDLTDSIEEVDESLAVFDASLFRKGMWGGELDALKHFQRYSADLRADVPVEAGIADLQGAAVLVELTLPKDSTADRTMTWGQWWRGKAIPMHTELGTDGTKLVTLDLSGGYLVQTAEGAANEQAMWDRWASSLFTTAAKKKEKKEAKDLIKGWKKRWLLHLLAGQGAKRLWRLGDAESAELAYSPAVFLARLVDVNWPRQRLVMAQRVLEHEYSVWEARPTVYKDLQAAKDKKGKEARKVAKSATLACAACPEALNETALATYKIMWLKPRSAGLPPAEAAVSAPAATPDIMDLRIASIRPAAGAPGTRVTLELVNVDAGSRLVKFGGVTAALAPPTPPDPQAGAAGGAGAGPAPAPVDSGAGVGWPVADPPAGPAPAVGATPAGGAAAAGPTTVTSGPGVGGPAGGPAAPPGGAAPAAPAADTSTRTVLEVLVPDGILPGVVNVSVEGGTHPVSLFSAFQILAAPPPTWLATLRPGAPAAAAPPNPNP